MDQFSIGKLLGDAALGFYSFAFRLANFPTVNITHVINQVLLPTFSLLQSDRERFRDRYVITTQLLMMVTIPLAVGFIVFGRDLLYLLYGEKWLPAVVVLQVLAVYGMLRSVGSTYGNVLIVSVKPEWLFYGAGIQILVAGTAIIMGASDYGIEGIAVVMTGALLVGILFNGVKVSKILGLKVGSWLRILGLPILISLIIVGLITMVLPGGSWGWLIARMASALLLYILMMYALCRDEISEVIHTIRSTFED
jgi:O-antigen/teichoic acid export membrane protein